MILDFLRPTPPPPASWWGRNTAGPLGAPPSSRRRFLLGLCLLPWAHSLLAGDWPAWRGPSGIGLCDETNLPLKWSSTENVRWRTPLPEAGNSTPVVWQGRIFVTQAVAERRTLQCFDRADGRLLWQQGVVTKEKEPTYPSNPYCSGSPVTDGERVIASFASDGLFCFDLDGRELWRRTDLGRQLHIWGGDCFVFKASPKFELVAVNSLGERSNSSIAASDGELYIRTHQALWCIAVGK